MRVLSLFDGVACGLQALKNLNIPITCYHASEIDKSAISIAKANHPEIVHLGDITQLHFNEGDYELVIGESPCQGFSKAGVQLNFDDHRSKLYFEFSRILKEIKPKYFLLENNKMKKWCEDIISNDLGVTPYKINSALVSSMNRERLYWTNIPFTYPTDKKIYLNSIIGDYDWIYVVPRGYNKKCIHSYKGKCPCITCSAWNYNFFYIKDYQTFKFTAEQAEQIQGLPIGYTANVPLTKRFKAIGNGWNIPTIECLFNGLK